MENGDRASVERDVDGSSTEYFDLDVRGDRVERLMREIFDHRDATPEARVVRRVGRAAFFVTRGGGHAPASWGLRLWNGRGEQLITVLFPSPFYDGRLARLPEPDWSRTRLWNELRARFSA